MGKIRSGTTHSSLAGALANGVLHWTALSGPEVELEARPCALSEIAGALAARRAATTCASLYTWRDRRARGRRARANQRALEGTIAEAAERSTG